MPKKTDEDWMSFSLRLASRGRHAVSPNPMVGACVVRKNRLIACGYHKKFGGPHAERLALDRAGKRTRGATLYVTLEPCGTWKKTPPCAPLIVERGIKKVVIGSLDPNPANHGKGLRYLRAAGVSVRTGILSEQVRSQNEGFFSLMTRRRPFVTLKMAQTMDGKIATRKGKSRWISSPPSRDFVHKLRARQDAVMVGKNTFLEDDPRITVPPKSKCFKCGKPWKIVMVSREFCRPNARVFDDSRMTVMVCPRSQVADMMDRFRKLKGNIILLPVKDKKGRLDIADLLEKLGGMGVSKLLVEGGGEFAWSLIKAGCVDRAFWILSPKIFGGRNARTSVEGTGVGDPESAYFLKTKKVITSGSDWIFEGTIVQNKK
ncbi:MAG: Riboflavin biosynthesis protein RibD [Candidatus Omnitrophica bacterium ADurb.Bin277]|nr:MAG: Riboflavin biosynthesis protein RibD [Candidatus Omnitrophica bacterium ADurb.Bin277]